MEEGADDNPLTLSPSARTLRFMGKSTGKKLKHRHHTVPKFYLSRFANDREQIVRVALPGDKSNLMNIRDATVINNFYLLETSAGEWTDVLEDVFGSVEAEAAEAVRAVVDDRLWPPSDKQRGALAEWAALQHVRVPSMRQQQDEIADFAFKMQVAVGGKRQVRKVLEAAYGRPPTEEEVEAEWERVTRFESYRATVHPNEHLKLIGELAPRATTHLYNMAWGIVWFERKPLVTADIPVVLMPHPESPPYGGVGLATAGGFLIPIDRRAALMIANRPGDDYVVRPNAQLANEINQMIVRTAHRTVFHHPDDRPLDRLVIPGPREKALNVSSDPRAFLMPDGWPKADGA